MITAYTKGYGKQTVPNCHIVRLVNYELIYGTLECEPQLEIVFIIQRPAKRCANLTKQDLGKARPNR